MIFIIIIKYHLRVHRFCNLFYSLHISQHISFFISISSVTMTIPLHQYAEAGAVKEILPLIRAGVDVDERDAGGQTALHKATWKGKVDVVRVLLAHNANPSVVSNSGLSPLIVATLFGHDVILQRLVDAGASLNARDHWDWTALFYAAGYGRTGCAAILLSAGADAFSADKTGQTALDIAVQRRHTTVIYLIDQSRKSHTACEFVI